MSKQHGNRFAGSSREPAYYRPHEVAKMLRCSEWWVKEQARNRRIPFSWIGGSYLFTSEHVKEIVALFEQRPVQSTPSVTGVARSAAPRPKPIVGKSVSNLTARTPRRARAAGDKSAA
ncbi:helix-turn-helix domain-containing protein [Actinosynnema sp. NPDC059335]|uniref:helix-turn-helix domain-containing protein n=1 Tax=Actinosynnema sp. NPDC059335 TaxID=3346804 RepID=UPI003671324A